MKLVGADLRLELILEIHLVENILLEWDTIIIVLLIVYRIGEIQ